jgi:hypothetical protein
MQVGKKYNFKIVGARVTCTDVTKQGSFVVVRDGDKYEYLVSQLDYVKHYTEVKEPAVRYVHWMKRKSDGKICTFMNESTSKNDPFQEYEHVQINKVTYDG